MSDYLPLSQKDIFNTALITPETLNKNSEIKEMYGIIYIYRFPDGMVYVGQTVQVPFIIKKNPRINQEICGAIRKVKGDFHAALREFINEYSKEDVYKIVEIIGVAYSFDELNKLEIYYIDKYNSLIKGYNRTKGGKGSNGLFITMEYRERGEARPFVVYKKTGEYIDTFNYPPYAVEKLLELKLITKKDKKHAGNNIRRVLQEPTWIRTDTTSKRYFWHNLFFKYEDEMDDDWTFENQLKEIKEKKQTRYEKPFVVYNVDTSEYIGEYKLITQFCDDKDLNFDKYQGDFCAVLHKRQKTARGYFLKYKDEMDDDWTFENYLKELEEEKYETIVSKMRSNMLNKIEKFKNVSYIDDDFDKYNYIRPTNRNNKQTGWYVYIDGIQTGFEGDITLEDSKKLAIYFINILKKDRSNIPPEGYKIGSSSGYKGVYQDKRYKNKWNASVRRNKKFYALGTFNTPEEANVAVIKFKTK